MATKSSKSSSSGVDKKFQDEVKAILLEKKQSLLEKLNQWEDNSSPSGLKEMGDIADMASELNYEALTNVLTENEIEMIKDIEKALEKIEEGTYGICEGTKKKIPTARLKAIPWTRYTVEYAEKLSKMKPKPGIRNDPFATAAYPIPTDMDSSD